MNRKLIIGIVCVVIALLVATIVISWSSSVAKQRSQSEALERQRIQITYSIRNAGSIFMDEISLIEQKDSKGNPCYAGEISPDLAVVLPVLVHAYNNDTLRAKPITIEELRHNLTVGIAAATAEGTEESAFYSFLLWCGKEPVLVDTDGNSLRSRGLTNFKFVFYRADYQDRYFPWELVE